MILFVDETEYACWLWVISVNFNLFPISSKGTKYFLKIFSCNDHNTCLLHLFSDKIVSWILQRLNLKHIFSLFQIKPERVISIRLEKWWTIGKGVMLRKSWREMTFPLKICLKIFSGCMYVQNFCYHARQFFDTNISNIFEWVIGERWNCSTKCYWFCEESIAVWWASYNCMDGLRRWCWENYILCWNFKARLYIASSY